MATDAHDDALPDELLLDILARLTDPVDVLRCAAACKRWLRLLAADDAALLRRAGVLPENRNASILLGAFYTNYYYGIIPGPTMATEKRSDRSPQFWRLHGRPPADDVDRPGFGLFSILANHDGLFNYAKPLASCRGLLLVRLMPTPLDYGKLLHLAVCHPLLGGVHHVPPPPLVLHAPFQGRDVTGYSLLTDYRGEGLDDRRHRRLAFRVLFTAVGLDRIVNAYSYSSATGS
uniref:Uncharacterized protein n=1 Tax=Avena sativa TaxID=4498 RepID=A0ACD5VIK9_AVESA